MKYHPWTHYLLLYTCSTSWVACLNCAYYWQLWCSGWKPWCHFFILPCLLLHPPTYVYLMKSQNVTWNSEQFWPDYQCPIYAFLISHQDTMLGVSLHLVIPPRSFFPNHRANHFTPVLRILQWFSTACKMKSKAFPLTTEGVHHFVPICLTTVRTGPDEVSSTVLEALYTWFLFHPHFVS